MMKKIWLICVLILIPTCLFGEEWMLSKKQVEFGCDCQFEDTELLVKLDNRCSRKEFWQAKDGVREKEKNPGVYVLSSWQEFEQFRANYYSSHYFDTFSKEFFDSYRLGVVYVRYGGSTFIKNEELFQTENECGFSYEIWAKKMKAIPACLWSVLYLIQIEK